MIIAKDFGVNDIKTLEKVTRLYKKAHEMDCLNGYVKANFKRDGCDLIPTPSISVLKQYDLGYSDCNTFVWWLMEQYFEGNLLMKDPRTTIRELIKDRNEINLSTKKGQKDFKNLSVKIVNLTKEIRKENEKKTKH